MRALCPQPPSPLHVLYFGVVPLARVVCSVGCYRSTGGSQNILCGMRLFLVCSCGGTILIIHSLVLCSSVLSPAAIFSEKFEGWAADAVTRNLSFCNFYFDQRKCCHRFFYDFAVDLGRFLANCLISLPSYHELGNNSVATDIMDN